MSQERDDELDALERQLKNPRIERPEKLDIGPGALCWLNSDRRCGADCVAFNPSALDAHGVEDDGPAKCYALSSLMAVNAVAALLRTKPERPMPPPPRVG